MEKASAVKIKWDCFAGSKDDRTWLLTFGLYVKAKDQTEAEAQINEIVKRLRYGGGWHFNVKLLEETA